MIENDKQVSLTQVFALKRGLDEYVPWHNKSKWNSSVSDPCSILLNQAIDLGVVDPDSFKSDIGVSEKEFAHWRAGGYPDSPKVRKKVKKHLVRHTEAKLKTLSPAPV